MKSTILLTNPIGQVSGRILPEKGTRIGNGDQVEGKLWRYSDGRGAHTYVGEDCNLD